MFALLYKPKLRIPFPQIIKPQLGFLLHVSRYRTSSTSLTTENDKICPQEYPIAVSYLINKTGVSSKIGVSRWNKLKFESLDGPDSVLSFFRDHGFDNTHISKIISKCPNLLMSNPDSTLLPKLKFFSSIGASVDDVASNPYLLERSLDDKLIPCYDFLKSMLLSDTQILHIFRRPSVDFVIGVAASSVELLKETGVPQRYISDLVCRHPRVLSLPRDKLKKIVEEVLGYGIVPSGSVFVVALRVLAQMSKLTWEHKLQVYKRWGLSEEDVLLAFRKNPLCMSKSEKKITSVMDFLVNKMGFQRMAVSKYSVVMNLSLELRIIPRCSVVKVLQLKGLISDDLTLLPLSFLLAPEKRFVDRFITKYQQEVPQLLSAYQGKLGILELVES